MRLYDMFNNISSIFKPDVICIVYLAERKDDVAKESIDTCAVDAVVNVLLVICPLASVITDVPRLVTPVNAPVIVSPDFLTNDVMEFSFKPIVIDLLETLPVTVTAPEGLIVRISVGDVDNTSVELADIVEKLSWFVMKSMLPREFL
jgi:hypothetical protein